MSIAGVIGAALVLAGILAGNASLDTMATTTKPDVKNEIFSPGAQLDTQDVWTERDEGVKRYEEASPEGNLLKWRRASWILIASGFDVWLLGAFHK